VHIPSVILPNGFEASTINLIASGVCPNCKAKSE
jgi:Fe2+ or Zn2+ uptake regulation protein